MLKMTMEQRTRRNAMLRSVGDAGKHKGQGKTGFCVCARGSRKFVW